MLHTFQGHNDSLLYAVFSPDGSQVLTGSHDTTARLWKIPVQFFINHPCELVFDDEPTCPKFTEQSQGRSYVSSLFTRADVPIRSYRISQGVR
jgi:WD40 repeat protein